MSPRMPVGRMHRKPSRPQPIRSRLSSDLRLDAKLRLERRPIIHRHATAGLIVIQAKSGETNARWAAQGRARWGRPSGLSAGRFGRPVRNEGLLGMIFDTLSHISVQIRRHRRRVRACTQIAIIGAGPYGLSVAAHSRALCIEMYTLARGCHQACSSNPKASLQTSSGWVDGAWLDPDDVAYTGGVGVARAAE